MNVLPVTIDAAKTVDAIGGAIDKIFTSDEERANAHYALERLKQRPDELQAAINQVEAAHPSLFVAGWRPGAGWVCVVALLYAFILQPIAQDLVTIFGLTGCAPVIDPAAVGGRGLQCGVPLELPRLDVGELVTLLLALLGMSGLRTREKERGVAR